jgi:hypothetical protein
MSLVRAPQPGDEDGEALQARLKELETELRERSAETLRLQSDLAAFRISYRRDVGLLHEELDELERAIAEAELGELSRLVAEGGEAAAPRPSADADPQPRFTSDAVRKLFRDVAKTIHPDLAADAEARDRRHALMVEANRAYALGDEERLRRILAAWETSPEAVEGDDADAARLRLVRRIAQIQEQLDRYASELAALKDSPLGKLKTMVDEAAAQGKDLIADMVRRLQRDIMAARNRLDAITWHP